MKTDGPVLAQPRWTGVFLVCKACGKRSNGPRKLKPKELAGIVRTETKRSPERTRVVLTGCLGLCPKEAIALAHLGSGAAATLVAVRSRKQGRKAIGLLGTVPPA
jgi:hypothetical protein